MAGNTKYKHIVTCLGAGYVGGPSSVVLACKAPHVKVIVADLNHEQIRKWNSDKLPIYEPGLASMVAECRDRNCFFTTDVDGAILEADIIFVCVNTPTKTSGIGAGSAADLTMCELAARQIARTARSDKIVVEKSTVPVRTAESIRRILDANSISTDNKNDKDNKNNKDKDTDKDEDTDEDTKVEKKTKYPQFEVLSNPEFMAEGSAIQDLISPDRVLIGSLPTERGLAAAKVLSNLYANWIAPEKIVRSSLWSTELSKLAANAMLAQRISSINSFSALCERTGANIDEVARAIGMDRRIGPHFLQASVGFGGSCFHKDISNLVYICRHTGLDSVADYWNQVLLLNEYQTNRFADKIIGKMFNTVSHKRIAVFGFAFKKNTGDTRESPALIVVQRLLEDGAMLAIWDPKVAHEQITEDLTTGSHCRRNNPANNACVGKNVLLCADPYEAACGAHAIVILTEWDEFKEYDYHRLFAGCIKPAFLFDGRNILDHSALANIGFETHAIGKSSLA